MGIFKHFLLIGLVLTSVISSAIYAQDEGVIPESESVDLSEGAIVPHPNSSAPVPPMIIDESDSSAPSDSDDYDN